MYAISYLPFASDRQCRELYMIVELSLVCWDKEDFDMPRLISSLLFLSVALVSETLAQSDGCFETDPDTKFSHSQGSRIIDGNITTIDKFPYQISLQKRGDHKCGGSIISSEWVLTAAHCVHSSTDPITVRAGTTTREDGGSVHEVAQIVIHPSFNPFPPDYDIAAMRIEGKFTFSANVQTIRLANSMPPPGTVADVTGWGFISVIGPLSMPLRVVSVPIWSEDNCKSVYDIFTPRMLCAGYTDGGKDACVGDSGGPLVAGGEQVGVVSGGDSCGRPCKPKVYSNVVNLRSWITSVTGV